MSGRGEKGEYDARILGGGDFVAGILREAGQRERRYLPERDRGGLIDRTIREMCKKEDVREGEVRLGGQTRRVSRVRAEIGLILSREYGIPMAEIARHLGVCTSGIAKAIRRKMEGKS